jgi:tRNA threonylcarbamoyladenosine biosynthesis protein TsaB|tara:strand:- start:408 stop:1079 length:672 start_codon:yes stop_codon:yes gene_type:complete
VSLILNLETATKNCSVSLAEDGIVIVLKEFYDGNFSHAEKLNVFINDVLSNSSKTLQDLDAIAVSKGPGSYTGLRIGVSSAKGLCFALDIPLISVSTLQSLSLQVSYKGGFIIPMLDARRMEVYSAVFDKNNDQIRDIKAEILDTYSFETYLNKGITYFIGDGVTKTKTIIEHPNARYIENKLPSANEMAILSYFDYKNDNFENVAYFEPFYLKDFVTNVKPQ